jgi:hypothetical protein
MPCNYKKNGENAAIFHADIRMFNTNTYYDTPTGERVCTTCGATITFKNVEERRRIEKMSRQGLLNQN